MSHQVSAGSLGGVALGLDSRPLLEDGSLQTVVKVPGLGDLPVLLALADLAALTQTSLQMLALVPLSFNAFQLFLNLHGFVIGNGVNIVGSFAVTVKGLLPGDKVRVVQRALLQSLLIRDLEVVRNNLATPGSRQIHVQAGQDSLLDVGDSNGLLSINKKGLNDTPSQMGPEGLLQVSLEDGGDGLLGLFATLLALNAIEGQELGLVKLDVKAVVGLGLDAKDRGQAEAGLVVGFDLRDGKVNLGFIAEDIFTLGLPGKPVGRVAKGSSHHEKDSQEQFHPGNFSEQILFQVSVTSR